MPGLSPSRLEAIFQDLGRIGETATGMQRLAFTNLEQQAYDYVKSILDAENISHRTDAFGNLFARIEGTDPQAPAIATGSHLDTVPNGGKYDGTIGVLAGLQTLITLKDKGLRHPVELIAFRAEESSRFGHSCMASKLMTGFADLEKWKQSPDAEGKTVFDALADNGFGPDRLDEARIDPSQYKAFLECHIEQGRVLEEEKISIGVVTGIAAPTRFRIQLNGVADHSGATPMGLRHDALVSAASIVTTLNALASSEASHGTVGTVGQLDVTPNSMNVIPGLVTMSVDIRGVQEESIQRVVDGLLAHVESIQGVDVKVTPLSAEKPVQLDRDIAGVLTDACIDENITHRSMLSGAGHDAMYMAKIMPTAMIFVPSNNGISHNPEEFTPFQDIWNASQILTRAIERLAE